MSDQGNHFWIMVIQCDPSMGGRIGSYQSTTSFPHGTTRLDAFNIIRERVNALFPKTAGGIVTHFDIQPNTL
jgi:hypothetical protein